MTTIQSFMRRTLVAFACFACCSLSAVAMADKWKYPTKDEVKNWKMEGNGTKNSPYLITSAQDLANLARKVYDTAGDISKSKYFKLTKDIVLNEIDPKDLALDGSGMKLENIEKKYWEWTPIGMWRWDGWDAPFKGVFDGDNHTIRGLVLKHDANSEYDNVGLFGLLGGDGSQVKNLNIADSYLMCDGNLRANAGFLIGDCSAGYDVPTVVYNCHVTNSNVNVYYTDKEKVYKGYTPVLKVGGLIGYATEDNDNIKIASCSFSGNMDLAVRNIALRQGGLVGQGGILNDCKTSGTVNVIPMFTDSQRTIEDKKDYPISINGLDNNAKTVKDCLSEMNFVLSKSKLPDNDIKNVLELSTLCNQAKEISQSACISKVTVNDLDSWSSKFLGYGIIAAGKNADLIKDCAVYQNVDGSNLPSYIGDEDRAFTFFPLFTTHVKMENVVVVDNGNFSTVNKALSSGGTVQWQDGDSYANGNMNDMSSNGSSIVSKYNGDQAMVWGTGKVGDYDNCPMPVACGGTIEQLAGDGSEANPYKISSEEELRFLQKNAGTMSQGKYFQLTADINMSGSEPLEPIGSSYSAPFRGTFDGNGHAIIGMKAKTDATGMAGLFGYVNGTIKNLAVIGTSFSKAPLCSPIACYLGYSIGDENNPTVYYTSTMTNCYAGGDINIDASFDDNFSRIAGLCYMVCKGSTISDCYFKGTFHTTGKGIVGDDITTKKEEIAGLFCGLVNMNLGTINNNYATFDVDCKDSKPYGVYTISMGGAVSNCFCSTNYSSTEPSIRTTDGSELVEQKELNDKTISDAFEAGAFTPVLKNNTKSYAMTDCNGNNVWMDAIPVAKDNNIFTYVPTDGDSYEKDVVLWTLPNVAVYNADNKSDNILNCTLVPAKALAYKPSANAEKTWANMHYPLALETYKHYYMLCLPATVQSESLPEGSKLFIGGDVLDDGSKYMNIVEADSVAAGIPFIAYIPDAKTGTTIDIAMNSIMAKEPIKQISDGTHTQTFGLDATFIDRDGIGDEVVQASKNVTESADGKLIIKEGKPGWTHVDPFTSYLVQQPDVELRSYVMLDETSSDIDDAIEDNAGKTVRVKLKRTLKNDNWNTVCLPFNMTAEEVSKVFGEGTKVEKLTDAQIGADGACTLTFEQADGIKAGEAYMVKPTNSNIMVYDIANRTITTSDEPTPTTKTLTDQSGNIITLSYCAHTSAHCSVPDAMAARSTSPRATRFIMWPTDKPC